MTLRDQEMHWEVLDSEADAVAEFVSSLDTWRLCMIGSVVKDELGLREQGKPQGKSKLH